MSTGIFDIIGPNMIGPSSSHTAGALRIAYLAGRLIHGGAKKVEFTLYGSFAHTYRGHGTDRALLAGVMGFAPDDLRIRDSFQIARERGLQYSFRIDTATEVPHPNTVGITLAGADGHPVHVTGVSIGGGSVRLRELAQRRGVLVSKASFLLINLTPFFCIFSVISRPRFRRVRYHRGEAVR